MAGQHTFINIRHQSLIKQFKPRITYSAVGHGHKQPINPSVQQSIRRVLFRQAISPRLQNSCSLPILNVKCNSAESCRLIMKPLNASAAVTKFRGKVHTKNGSQSVYPRLNFNQGCARQRRTYKCVPRNSPTKTAIFTINRVVLAVEVLCVFCEVTRIF
jgi:hypothetical protein